MKKVNWHNLSTDKIFQILNSSEKGLKEKEAISRLERYGLNKFPEEKKIKTIEIFLAQFRSPLILILLIAAAICFALQEFIDMSVILAAVFINVLLGFFQENKAEKTLERLKTMIEYNTIVIREGKEKFINSKYLVPGDVIILQAGDVVPADARLIKVYNLKTVEAVLTGESLPSTKRVEILPKGASLAERENMVYSGTKIASGRGKGIVVATGLATELGKVASLVKKEIEKPTPLQIKIGKLARFIGVIIGTLCFILFLTGILLGQPFLKMLLTAVAVAVGGIPEGLVIGLTICLTVGMQRILKKNALVRKLIAAETLGSVTVICSDKTGTLTKGKMTVSEIITSSKENLQEIKSLALKIALLCNNAIIENPEDEIHAWKISGEPTEKALLEAAIQNGLHIREIREKYPRTDEIPFDSKKKWMATLHLVRGKLDHLFKNKKLIFVKGAPEVIIKISKFIKINKEVKELSESRRKQLFAKCNKLTSKGLRLLAVAYKEAKKEYSMDINSVNELTFVALIALKDALRNEAPEVIRECRQAGIRPIMITGDSKLTAKAIAQEAGILTRDSALVLESKDLEKISDKEFKKTVKVIDVYARAEPKDKIRIVKALQEDGEIVAMTGDGVNDAPALKSADIGIALGSGSDVAKEAADIVLLDNNFKTIVDAVKEGRTIFANIKKIVLYLLSGSFTEMIIISLSLFFGLPLPVLPAQILWVNIIEDSLPSISLAYEKGEKSIIQKKPYQHSIPILDKEMKVIIFIISIFTDLLLFGLFYFLWKYFHDLTYARTMVFVGLGIDSLFYIYSCKHLRKTILHYNPFDNKFLNLSVLFGYLMFFIAIYTPFFQKILRVTALDLKSWLILIFLGLINLSLIEITKFLFITKDNVKYVEKNK